MQPLGARPILIDQAYEAILAAIADGRLKPGERLGQESLAEMLQVSRQPVSHALALLKQEGFVVDAGPGRRGARGVAVAPIDPAYLRALYQVRAALDSAAAGLAAERVAAALPEEAAALAAELAGLRETLEAGRRAVAFGDRPALATQDMAFHQGINRLSGNPVIVETAARQWGHVRRAIGAVLEDREQALIAWKEHGALLDAVATGQVGTARELARRHAERAGRSTSERLERQQQSPADGTAAAE